MEVKIRDQGLIDRNIKLEYATADAAGVDLYAAIAKPVDIPPLQVRLIGTGLSINMQPNILNMMALILPRSGKGHKEGKVLGNLVGVIDKDYTGELMVSLWNRNPEIYVTIEPYEKFAQLVFVPIIRPPFEYVEEFSTVTARGSGGFGSTGG